MRFVIVGGLATATHAIVASVLIGAFDWGAVAGNVLAAVTAAALSFVLNTNWSFQAEMGVKVGVRYSVVVISGFVVTAVVSHLTVTVWHLPALASVPIVVLVTPVLTFLAHNYWTYRRSPD